MSDIIVKTEITFIVDKGGGEMPPPLVAGVPKR